MPPVFAHGRLRLYLLKLLDEAPRHGYEVIRLLEDASRVCTPPRRAPSTPASRSWRPRAWSRTPPRAAGRCTPSRTRAGPSWPAAAVSWPTWSWRSASRSPSWPPRSTRASGARPAICAARCGAAAKEARTSGATGTGTGSGFPDPSGFLDGTWADKDGWRQAKEEFKRAKQEWKEQARRAKDESRRAREEAQRARRQAQDAQEKARSLAQEEVQRIARRIQEQVQDHFAGGDWPTGVQKGLSELAKEFSEFGMDFGEHFPHPPSGPGPGPSSAAPPRTWSWTTPPTGHRRTRPGIRPATSTACWTGFRDDVRDAAATTASRRSNYGTCATTCRRPPRTSRPPCTHGRSDGAPGRRLTPVPGRPPRG